MALPTSYLTSTKNLADILNALKSAEAPERFTVRFLQSLEFKSTNDRLIIAVLAALGFLSAERKPTQRYFRFLDQTQSAIVLAEGIKEAYADLFQVNRNANTLSKKEVIGKIKTLTEGKYSDSVLDKMGLTFLVLCKLADFKTKPTTGLPSMVGDEDEAKATEDDKPLSPKGGVPLGGLHYNIQIILPVSRDPKVYDVLFRSLKEHLL